MRPNDLIKSLEARGYRVSVRHEREYPAVGPREPLPKGGRTYATISRDVTPPNGQKNQPWYQHVASYVAHCHPNDNYNRRIGTMIAVGRAAKRAGLL